VPSLCLRLACTLLLAAGLPAAEAQIFDRALKSIQRGAERALEREAERRADQAVTGAIECAVGDTACEQDKNSQDPRNQAPPATPEQPGQAPPAPGAAASGNGGAGTPRPGEGAFANYDFVPGDRVIFVEDFTSDRVGNFPRRLRFVRGNAEIVEWGGSPALRVNSGGTFDIPLPGTLPERFTIELEVCLSSFVNDFQIYPVDGAGTPQGPQFVQVDAYGGTGVATFDAEVRRGTLNLNSLQTGLKVLEQAMTPVRVLVDGDYVKVFVNETRVDNVPQARLGRGAFLRLDFVDVREDPILLRRIHVAETERTLYDRLRDDGRVATQGIFFASGSATLQPESTPTLKEIAAALRQSPGMRLMIEGHTDNAGDAAANQSLSEQRARAVVDHLAGREQIAAARLESAGFGATRPSADNTTAEGRQQNRRVELVVLP